MTELKDWIAKNRKFVDDNQADMVGGKYNQMDKRRALRSAVFPGKDLIDDAPDGYLNTITKITDTYLTAMKKHDAKLQEIDRDYKGDMARQKYAEQKAKEPKLAEYIDAMRTYTDLERLEIDATESLTFNAANITEDYKFLQLPAVLTVEEIKRLHDRNSDNPIFCRALQKYCADNEIDAISNDIDLRNSLEARRSTLDSVFDTHVSIMKDRDELTFALYGEMGYYDTAREQLGANSTPAADDAGDSGFVDGFSSGSGYEA